MSRYRYTGTGATYPALDITVVPGDVAELSSVPDANWISVDATTALTVTYPSANSVQTWDARAGSPAWRTQNTLRNTPALVRRLLPKPADIDAVMVTPPTVSALATATAIGSAVKWPSITTSGTTRIPSDHFNYLGAGGFTTYGTSFPDYTYVKPTNGSNGWTATYCVEFFFDGATIELIFKGVAGPGFLRVRVDGQLVSATATTLGVAGNDQLLPLTFASRAVRRITVEATIAPWGGVNVGPNDTIWKSETRGPRVIVIGDSITNGTGAAAGGVTAWPRKFSQAMGWQDCWASGIGGTGYLNPGAFVKFRDRIVSDCLAWAPDIIVVAGGINDIGTYTAALIGAESLLLFQQIMTALPGVVLIATSAPWNSGVSSFTASNIACRDAVKASVLAVGGTFVDLWEKPTDQALTATALAAGTAISATTISLPGVVPIQSTVDIDPTGVRERRRVLNVSGGGPFTHTLDVALTAAHVSGVAVNQVGPSHWTGTGHVGATTGVGNGDLIVGADATHPTQAGHDYLGMDLAFLVSRALMPV